MLSNVGPIKHIYQNRVAVYFWLFSSFQKMFNSKLNLTAQITSALTIAIKKNRQPFIPQVLNKYLSALLISKKYWPINFESQYTYARLLLKLRLYLLQPQKAMGSDYDKRRQSIEYQLGRWSLNDTVKKNIQLKMLEIADYDLRPKLKQMEQKINETLTKLTTISQKVEQNHSKKLKEIQNISEGSKFQAKLQKKVHTYFTEFQKSTNTTYENYIKTTTKSLDDLKKKLDEKDCKDNGFQKQMQKVKEDTLQNRNQQKTLMTMVDSMATKIAILQRQARQAKESRQLIRPKFGVLEIVSISISAQLTIYMLYNMLNQ